jgi:DNA-binding CsgD family transcriptional regulator
MDIQVIRKTAATSSTPQLSGTGELITLLGDAAFPQSLFAQVQKLCGCAHFVALTSSEQKPIKVVLATNEGSAPLARETAERYVADHWRHDPINAVLPKLGPSDVSVRTTPRDIDSNQYRKDCYSRPNLIERFSILRRRDRLTDRLHLYRAKGSGAFSDREVEAMSGVSGLLFALVAKHSEITAPAVAGPELELRHRIFLTLPGITRREGDVCVGIARGQTTEAIALSLGVSANTVLTYRKRVYARLHITSANELLALIYASVQAATKWN